MNESFTSCMEAYGYGNQYKQVFPLRVSQSEGIVTDFIEAGNEYSCGLAASSKPELLIALASLKRKRSMIVCTGPKDNEYIEIALLAQQLGQLPILIVEKVSEIPMLLNAAKKLGVQPTIGIRVRMQDWEEIGDEKKHHTGISVDIGDKSKLGLSSIDVMACVAMLRKHNMLDCLQMFHYFIGSQICNIRVIRKALREAAHYYVQLSKLGCNMKYMDVGGGLAIDYIGAKKSATINSSNYTVDEFAADVITGVKEVCSKANVPVPMIITECGRVITAHQSVLIFNVTDATTVQPIPPSETGLYGTSANLPEPVKTDHELCFKLYEVLKNIAIPNLQESLHDARQYKDEALALFTLGMLSLSDRGKIETIYWCCINDVVEKVSQLRYVPEELAELKALLSYTYYCNFSLFQSVPESWSRQAIFPTMPIHRLTEKPTKLATLADLTCDSDGKVCSFITTDSKDKKRLLELHSLEKGKAYYVGMFLAGAYNESLGNLHNLYGDCNIVQVSVDVDDIRGYSVDKTTKGETVNKVLGYFQYNTDAMLHQVRMECEKAVKAKELTLPQYKLLTTHYEKCLRNYTYLSSHSAVTDGTMTNAVNLLFGDDAIDKSKGNGTDTLIAPNTTSLSPFSASSPASLSAGLVREKVEKLAASHFYSPAHLAINGDGAGPGPVSPLPGVSGSGAQPPPIISALQSSNQ